MRAEQFLGLLKILRKHNVNISYDQITLLSSIPKDNMDRLMQLYQECVEENKKYYIETLTNEEFITYYGYETILKIIAKLDNADLIELKGILDKEDVIMMPRLMDYINTYYKLITKPGIAYTIESANEIISVVPEVEFTSDASELKMYLLEHFDYEYAHYVTDIDEFFFEDFDTKVEDSIFNYFYMKNKNKKRKPEELIRYLTKKEIIKPEEKIIKFHLED